MQRLIDIKEGLTIGINENILPAKKNKYILYQALQVRGIEHVWGYLPLYQKERTGQENISEIRAGVLPIGIRSVKDSNCGRIVPDGETIPLH